MKHGSGCEVYLVTGGSRGIGLAICRQIARRGGVVLAFTHKGPLEDCAGVLAELRSTNPETHAFPLSLEDRVGIGKVVEEIVSRFGRIDHLVNNAGILNVTGYLVGLKETELAEIIQVNLLGTMEMCRVVGKQMVRQRAGTIVNISSTLAFRQAGSIHQAPYVASKAGIHGLTRALSTEMARFGIRVLEIAPGWIDTDLIEHMPGSLYQRLMESIPLRRFGRPEEVAATVDFLLSGKCGYFVGQSLVVDGGASV